jgi:hypothetical protein
VVTRKIDLRCGTGDGHRQDVARDPSLERRCLLHVELKVPFLRKALPNHFPVGRARRAWWWGPELGAAQDGVEDPPRHRSVRVGLSPVFAQLRLAFGNAALEVFKQRIGREDLTGLLKHSQRSPTRHVG